jgi:hypothetical protein
MFFLPPCLVISSHHAVQFLLAHRLSDALEESGNRLAIQQAGAVAVSQFELGGDFVCVGHSK